MNLLLLDHSEVNGGTATLSDRRADHVRTVLRSRAGDRLRIGILDGPLGYGVILGLDANHLQLACTFEDRTPPLPDDTLLLAIPRPNVLKRCLAHAAALGFGRIALLRCRHVDKSHLLSRTVQDPAVLRDSLLAGLEQACRTRMPSVRIIPRFRPFVADELATWLPPQALAIAADPTGIDLIDQLASRPLRQAPLALAIGPERGFVPYEIQQLETAGLAAANIGPHPLRVETALAVATGQLQLWRQWTTRSETRG